MPETFQLLRAFISSPGDVAEERRIAEEVIGRVSQSCRETLGVHVEPRSWEQLPPLTRRMPEESIQQRINEIIKACQIFILILNKRYGTIEPGYTVSNTEREIEIAFKNIKEGKDIMFLSYFRELPPNEDPGSQEEKVRKLRRELTKQNLFKEYKTPSEFKDELTHDLYHTILESQMRSSKRKILRSFWQLGVPEGATHPRLSIIYPPVDRCFMKQEAPDQFWLRRLVPHIVFEDFKSLQKIEKTLRLTGFRDFEFFSLTSTPPDIQKRNRLWICLPRSDKAVAQLARYKDRTLFRFLKGEAGKEARIQWRSALNSKPVAIRSPLGKYLREQRKEYPGGDWRAGHGMICAKDFAVLARFSDWRKELPMSFGTLKDYFLAGIRGLGTWGAGWFIDRRYNALNKYLVSDDCDVQILLEVTYKNERILEVRDVSQEPEAYFRDENDIRTIRRRIKEHC